MDAAATPFFVTGGTLRSDDPSYVARRADDELYDGLSRGEFCYLLTARQMGKSSLMVRTAARLRHDGVAAVVLDLTQVGQNLSPEQWYDGLLAQVGVSLDLEDELDAFWFSHERLGPLQRWLTALREVVLARIPGRVVIFIEEVDAVRSLPFSADEFFAGIRECYNHRAEDPEFARLTFCLLGVASPADLIQDTRTTPFNIGRRIELTDLTAGEAAPLARGLGREEPIASRLLERVLYWTGGHPYLTQRLCRAVAQEGKATDAAGVDRLCQELFLAPRAQEQDDNLLFVRQRLLRSELDTAGLLDLYAQVRRAGRSVQDDETSPWVTLLKLSGIVRSAGGCLQVRNRIYEQVFDGAWITKQMPDAELRRQQAAYRRGLVRATTLSAAVLGAVGTLAGAAWQQARVAREASRREAVQRRAAEDGQLQLRRQLYVSQMGQAQQAWEKGDVGRALGLLDTQRPKPGEEDLRAFDWRYLWHLCQGDSIATFRGHTEGVVAVSFSGDARSLASASVDGTTRRWEIATTHERAVLKLPSGPIEDLAFSPDGKFLCASGGDKRVTVWEVAPWRRVAVFTGSENAPSFAAFSADGRLLALTDGRTVKLWDVPARRQVASIPTGMALNCLALSADGRTLATGEPGVRLKLWDVPRRRERTTLSGHTGWITNLAFSPDGRRLASTATDSTIRLWDVVTGRDNGVLIGGMIDCITFSPDGKTLASGGSNTTVTLWDIERRKERATLRGHTASVTSVAFSPDGRTLASGSEDRTVKLWPSAGPVDRTRVVRDSSATGPVAFSPDGKLVATGGLRTVGLWDARTARPIATLNAHTSEVWDLDFSPNGAILASAGSDGLVRFWDVAARKEIGRPWKHPETVWAVGYSPDGGTLASHDLRGTVRILELATKRTVRRLEGHQGHVGALKFSPDGRILVVAGAQYNFRLWDTRTWKEITLLKGHEEQLCRVAFSPDGRLLATGSFDGKAKLWDMTTLKEIATLKGHVGGVPGVAFSPDGKTLATGGWDSTVRLWNVALRTQVLTLEGHSGVVAALAFSPDGNLLASTSIDGALRLWPAASFTETDAAPGARARHASP
jgi:WD40 repeat protein